MRRSFHVAIAKKQVEKLLRARYIIPEDLLESIILVLSEAGTNIIKHAKQGFITITEDVVDGKDALVLTVEDEGPGIQDIDQAVKDGYSTFGTLGIGFKVMKNNSDILIVENTDKGLRVKAFWYIGSRIKRLSSLQIDVATYTKPMEGYSLGGDLILTKQGEDGSFFGAVIDVLGHGIEAYESVKVIKKFWTWYSKGKVPAPLDFLKAMARQLSADNLRDAVVAAGRFVPFSKELEIVGVGNITVALLIDDHLHLPYLRGGVLTEQTKMKHPLNFKVKKKLIWAMASDGFNGGWPSLCKEKKISSARQCLGLAVRNYRKVDDDASMMVLKWISG